MEKKKIEYIALDNHVLAVAIEGEINDWACYIGAVKGNDFSQEYKQVAERGTKLSKEISAILFPTWAINFNWRF